MQTSDSPLPVLSQSGHDDLRAAVGSLHDFVGLRDRTIKLRIGLLWLLVALNIADVFSTATVLERGGRELNPVMAPIVGSWVVSLGAKLLVIALMWTAALRAPVRSRSASIMLATGATFYAGVVIWNLLGLVTHAV